MIMNLFSNIKQRLDKKLFLLLGLCVAMILFLTGCATIEDYEYELPNGFSLIRANIKTVTLNASGCIYEYTSDRGGKGLSSFAVESYIHEFAYNERYVAVKQFDPDKINFDDFESNDFSSPLYYLVDTVSTDVFGPYQTQEQFETACREFDVGDLGEWIVTSSDPNKRETH